VVAVLVLLMEGFVKYAVEVGSGAVLYIRSFIKTDFEAFRT
jgi:hypothetical protein